MSRLYRAMKLPRTTIENGVKLRTERYVKAKHLEALVPIIQAATKEQVGLDDDQLNTVQEIHDLLHEDLAALVFHLEENNEIVAALWPIPSPNCRSNKPIVCGGYAFTKPDFRGRGIAGSFMKNWSQEFGTSEGYIAFVGRTAITAKLYMPSRQNGYYGNGVLPHSVCLGKKKWVDDLLLFSIFEDADAHSEVLSERVPKTLPELLKNFNPQVQKKSLILADSYSLPGGKTLTYATGDDYWTLENLFRSSAEEGVNYALDEFTDSGCLNRKLMRDPDSFVVKNSDGIVMGGGTFGQAELCRSLLNKQLHLYMVVDKQFANKNVAGDAVSILSDEAQDQGWEGILTDFLYPSPEVQAFAAKNFFTVIGSLYKSAYLKNFGFVDSTIMYKHLVGPLMMRKKQMRQQNAQV